MTTAPSILDSKRSIMITSPHDLGFTRPVTPPGWLGTELEWAQLELARWETAVRRVSPVVAMERPWQLRAVVESRDWWRGKVRELGGE